MKVIGRIEPSFIKDTDGFDIVGNAEYVDGYVVQLTRVEAHIVRMLQESLDGYTYSNFASSGGGLGKPKDGGLSHAFALVWEFANTRFAVNEFKDMVSRLEETMNRTGDIPDDL